MLFNQNTRVSAADSEGKIAIREFLPEQHDFRGFDVVKQTELYRQTDIALRTPSQPAHCAVTGRVTRTVLMSNQRYQLPALSHHRRGEVPLVPTVALLACSLTFNQTSPGL